MDAFLFSYFHNVYLHPCAALNTGYAQAASMACVPSQLFTSHCEKRIVGNDKKRQKNVRDLEMSTYTVFIQYPSDKSVTTTLAVNLASVFPLHFLFGEM